MGTGRGTCFKRITASVLAAAIIAIIVAVCVVYIPRDHSINDGPKVTNKEAFKNGGARKHPSKNDGKDHADDQYTYYPGNVSNYPKKDEWVSFNHMWKSNLLKMQTACTKLGFGENNSDEENDYIKDGIQYVGKASLVDQRFILAIIMQESTGCLRVNSTDSVHGVHNPGIMQSHNGASFDEKDAKGSIRQMIKDGTQGTKAGDGLVQLLSKFPDAYSAARGYNSGALAKSGDLSDAIGATPCYASDIANRLMGWVNAASDCKKKVASVPQSDPKDVQNQNSGTDSQQQQPSTTTEQNQPSPAASSSTASSTDGSSSSTFSDGSTDGVFSGGHWDDNGNYVKNEKKKRRTRTRTRMKLLKV